MGGAGAAPLRELEPTAAALALRTRLRATLGVTDEHRLEEVETTAAETVLDGASEDELAGDETVPAGTTDEMAERDAERLAEMIERAEGLKGKKNDPKLALLRRELEGLVAEGFRPVVFCRYIATAHYLAEALAGALGRKGALVQVVTGELTPEEREERIERFAAEADDRIPVLIATDCLSEGINLQQALHRRVAKLPLIESAALAQCDAADGLEDGLVPDPMACDFDATALQCAEGADPASCLIAEEAEIVNLIYDGLKHPQTGEQIWPGFEPTGEAAWEGHPRPFAIQLGYSAYMVFKDPDWGWRTFEFDDPADFEAMTEANMILSPMLEAIDPDLSAFAKSGGKLLMWHGWLDQNIAPRLRAGDGGGDGHRTVLGHPRPRPLPRPFRRRLILRHSRSGFHGAPNRTEPPTCEHRTSRPTVLAGTAAAAVAAWTTTGWGLHAAGVRCYSVGRTDLL